MGPALRRPAPRAGAPGGPPPRGGRPRAVPGGVARSTCGASAAAIDHQFERWELSPAEREVALLLLKGLRIEGDRGGARTSERTVRQQALAVYRKAGLAGRAELAAFFLEDLLRPAPAPRRRVTHGSLGGRSDRAAPRGAALDSARMSLDARDPRDPAVRGVDDLVAWFRARERPRDDWKVGLEHEKLAAPRRDDRARAVRGPAPAWRRCCAASRASATSRSRRTGGSSPRRRAASPSRSSRAGRSSSPDRPFADVHVVAAELDRHLEKCPDRGGPRRRVPRRRLPAVGHARDRARGCRRTATARCARSSRRAAGSRRT